MSSPECNEVDSRLARHRSKITNNPAGALPTTNGNSTWARRRRDLVLQFLSELGRPATGRDHILISNTASAQVRVEQMQAAVVNGEAVDDAELIRLSGLVARLLSALPRRSETKQRLSDYIASRATAGGA